MTNMLWIFISVCTPLLCALWFCCGWYIATRPHYDKGFEDGFELGVRARKFNEAVEGSPRRSRLSALRR